MIPDIEIERRIKDSYELPNNTLESNPRPLVSVRTSTYQHAKYIRDCIEGVLAQKTSFPFEFIIGEDYSTDGTRELVLEYANRHPDLIRVITADYNVGVKANGRRCFNALRGKYHASCEGDDYWSDPYKLEKQVRFLESHPEYVLSHTDVDFFYDSSQQMVKNYNTLNNLNLASIEKPDEALEQLMSNSYVIRTATAIVRTHILQQVLEKPSLKYARTYFPMGDISTWLEISQTGKIHYLDESTAVYRVSAGTTSRPHSAERKAFFALKGAELRYYYSNLYPVSYSVQRKLSRNLRLHAINLLVFQHGTYGLLPRDLKFGFISKLLYFALRFDPFARLFRRLLRTGWFMNL